MSWFPVDDAFHSHPKAQKAGDEALGMWCRAGSHCMAYLTDGFVAEWWVKQQPKGIAKAAKLVTAGLWRTAKRDGEQGFQFHDWKPECTKSHIEAARENARQRKAKSRESRGESHVTGHVTERVSPPSCLGPTQPNPTQPSTPTANAVGGATRKRAKPRTRIPDGYMPTRPTVDKVKAEFPVTDAVLRSVHDDFCLYWQGQGKPMADWDATWLRWMRKELTKHQPTPNGSAVDNKVNDWLALAKPTPHLKAISND